MNSNLQNDMACLVDSLEFFKDDIPQRTQALEHLADMCLQDKGSILFNKTNGLATVFKIAFNKNTPQVVVQKALLTLGNACLKSDENKGILWSEQVLQFLHDILLSKDQSVKIIASTTYFLACLCSNNEKAQNKARKSKCLEKLVTLYRYYHPKGNQKNFKVEEWFDKADINSPVILNHISHALKALINKPKNVNNQMICSRLLNLAITTVLSTSNSDETKIEALQFISDCIFENENTKRIFNMIGGICFLSQFVSKELNPQRRKKEILPAILDTLSIAISDNESNKKSAGEAGMVKCLLKCLKCEDLSDTVHLKSFICLSEIIHNCSLCQEKLMKCDGMPIVIGIMSKKQDDITAKIGTSILHSCMQNLSDHQINESEAEDNEPLSSLSGILSFFSGKKKSPKKEKKNRKFLKGLLRSIKSSDPEHLKQVNDLIKHIEDSTVKKPQKIPLKTNLRSGRKDSSKKLSEHSPKSPKVNKKMMQMLKEQTQLLKNFKADINNLRVEITSQTSDCGGSCVSHIQQSPHVNSTHSKTKFSNSVEKLNFTPLRMVYLHQACTAPPKPCTIHHVSAFQAVTPLRNSGVTHVRVHEGRYAHKYQNKFPMEAYDKQTSDEYMEKKGNRSPNKDFHQDLNFDENDERPALFQTSIDVKSISDDVETMENSALIPNNSINITRTNQCSDQLSITEFRVPSVIEKVQRWREQTRKHEFKVPVLTPLLKKRRLQLNRMKTKGNGDTIKNTFTPISEVKSSKPNYEYLQHAPRKHSSTKGRIPISRDEVYVDQCFTPEQRGTVNWDEVKRTLNFEGLSIKKKIVLSGKKSTKEKEENQNYLERESLSSGFVDFNTQCSKTYLHKKDNKNFNTVEERCNKNIIACIGCDPFQRGPLSLMNSRNVMAILRKKGCDYHVDAFQNRDLLIEKAIKNSNVAGWKTFRETPSKKKDFAICDKNKTQEKVPFHNWESMSVFSFRSEHNGDSSDDDESMCSRLTTVNTSASTARRRRQEYTKEEIQFILRGIERYGTRWTAILNSYPFKSGRHADDLRNKYKQMKRREILVHNMGSRLPRKKGTFLNKVYTSTV